MDKKALHKKANVFAWVGFLLIFPTNVLVKILNMEGFSILYLVCFLLLAYGCWLELKSKNRHWTWIFLLALWILGALIIFALKDKTINNQTPAIPT